MADPEPTVEPVIVDPSRAGEDIEHDAVKEESHQESGDTKPPKEHETTKIAINRKPRADETLQTDSKVSVFKRKELKDEYDQTSFATGNDASSGSATRKSSQPQSQQSAGQQSRKSSRAQPTGEAEVKDEVSWISRRTGKMMQCKSQQTSAVWEKRPLADILHQKSKSVDADRQRICGFPEEKSDQWVSKGGKLVRNTSQQTNKTWERKPLADILRAGNKELEPEEEKVAPAKEPCEEEAETKAAEAEEVEPKEPQPEAQEEAPPAEKPAEEVVPAESEAEKPEEEAQPEVQEAEPEKEPEEEPPQEEKPEEPEEPEPEPEKKEPEEEEVKEETQEPKEEVKEEEEPPETAALEAQPELAEKPPSQITRVVSSEDVTFTNERTGAEVKNTSQQTSESLFVAYLTKLYGAPPCPKEPEAQESKKSIQYLEMRESQILEPEAQEPSQEPEAKEPEAQEPEAQEPEAQEPEAQEPEAQEPEEKKSKKSIEEKSIEEPEVEEPAKNIEEMETEEPLKSALEPDLLEKDKDESQKEMEKEGELPADEEFDKTESQATLESICSYVEGEDKGLQTYSIISLEDGIWLNRKTGKFLISHTQQTSESFFMTSSHTSLKDAPPKLDEKRPSTAEPESKAEAEQQPSSGKASKQSSRQGSRPGSQQGSRPESRHGSQHGSRPESPRHGSQTASRKGSRTESQTASRKGSRTSSQKAEQPSSRKGSRQPASREASQHETQAVEQSEGEEHGTDDVEKMLSRRLSEATLQSLEALDTEEAKSVRTYSSINAQEGTWLNNRTGRQLASQAQQTELSCFQAQEGDTAPPEEK